MTSLENRKIAIAIAYRNFRDEEYEVPHKIFEELGADVRTFSDELGVAQGVDGMEVSVDAKLVDLDVTEFDAIVFVGGPGTLEHLDVSESYQIAKDAITKNKILSAICVAPEILAKAGVLQGKKATVWTSSLNKDAQRVLEQNGAIYQSDSLVVDGKIITADGPEAAEEFANKIVDVLK
jgi:protease I